MSELKAPDPAKLYRAEVYTDLEVSEIRVLVPVDVMGEIDFARPARFFSEISIGVNGMQYPVRFELEAATLADAIEAFPETARLAAEGFLKELERRRTERKLVVPAGTLPPVH